jgi:hypothetical protein
MRLRDGSLERMPLASMGAEGRYEDYIYLQMMEREWKRPATLPNPVWTGLANHPSERAALVLVFWTYFETRLERLIKRALEETSPAIADDLLRRYASIGSRMDRLYKILFATTYLEDLTERGFPQIAVHIANVQQRRNEFSHGHPMPSTTNWWNQWSIGCSSNTKPG